MFGVGGIFLSSKNGMILSCFFIITKTTINPHNGANLSQFVLHGTKVI